MATYLARIRVYAGKEAEFEAVARTMYAATQLEVRCRQYQYWRAAEERCYYTFAAFDDYDAFLDHQISEHHESADFGPLIEDFSLEWLDAVPGASEIATTQSFELSSDAPATKRRHQGMLPLVLQAWWPRP
ncbi:MAG: antibiotic biosynthesis monooxygenase [Pseudomonadota bacterium]